MGYQNEIPREECLNSIPTIAERWAVWAIQPFRSFGDSACDLKEDELRRVKSRPALTEVGQDGKGVGCICLVL